MSRLKVGLIGYGQISQAVHLPLLERLPHVRLTAIAEADEGRREAARRRAPDAAIVSDYQDLIRRPDVDAVIVCLPTALHAEAAEAAISHGKHLYLEKPIATDLPAAQKVLAAWKRADVVGQMGFNYRFNPLYEEARRCLQAGHLGELVAARSVFATAARPLPNWKETRRTGGGALLDLASHHADLVRFFFGQEVRAVFAQVRSQRSEGDSAVLEMRLVDGLLVQTFVSLSAVEEDRFEIYGQAGKLTVDRYRSVAVEITRPRLGDGSWLETMHRRWHVLARSRYRFQKRMSVGHEPSYRASLDHFIAAARSGGSTGPDLWDGFHSLAIIAAAEESMRTGSASLVRDYLEEITTR